MERTCPRANRECPFFFKKLGCHTVWHHVFYPATKYQPETFEEEFRELPSNRVKMCKGEEDELHRLHPQGPPKPSTETMQYVLELERQKRELAV